MALSDFDNVKQLFDSLRTAWEQKRTEWVEISHFVGIGVDTDYKNKHGSTATQSRDLDEFVDDPTSAISVNQAGDYLMGIMWGTGDQAFDIIPSRYVTELVDEANVKEWYDFASNQALYHMNHEDAGFTTALRPYSYDQFSFGTSGIGTFKNTDFENNIADNALTFRNYGVDNTMIDEGKSGQVDTSFVIYNWKLNRIIGEFAMTDGVIDPTKLATLPGQVKKAYEANDYNQNFQIVFGFFPRSDFDPKLKGKRGTRYRGVWFLDEGNDHSPFFEEDFAERPIAIARAIKVRGETYGRASGTMLISTIRSVNFMVGTTIEIVDKMSRPSLGVFNSALFGDSVLDTSPDGLTVFNQSMTGGSGSPIFPIHDVGDPAAILSFLVPYLNEKIVTAFKVDSLLDFQSAKEMTATESLQRFAIRGKSLAGFLLQQKNELLNPVCKRSIGLLMSMGELGVNPSEDPERAQKLKELQKPERVIPDAVLEVMASGKPWYELRFNNELEQLTRTEAVDSLVQIIQAITAIAALNPDIIEAVNWYQLLKDINNNLDYNAQILISEDDFKAAIKEKADMQRMAMAMEAGQSLAQTSKDNASANKQNTEANNA